MTDIERKVNTYKTEYVDGFTIEEVEKLFDEYPLMNREKANSALRGITCKTHGKDMIIYHCDVIKALNCGIENRNLKIYEWD